MGKLNYFKGKICTVLTDPCNRFFNDTQHANVFVGIVDDVDELGVWLIQLSEKKRSFFTHRSLVGIIEESVTIFDTEEEAKEVRKQLETRLPQKDGQQLISVESLKKIKNDNQLEKKK